MKFFTSSPIPGMYDKLSWIDIFFSFCWQNLEIVFNEINGVFLQLNQNLKINWPLDLHFVYDKLFLWHFLHAKCVNPIYETFWFKWRNNALISLEITCNWNVFEVNFASQPYKSDMFFKKVTNCYECILYTFSLCHFFKHNSERENWDSFKLGRITIKICTILS